MVFQLVAVPIWVGVLRLVVVPSPSCPSKLAPQAQREPSLRRATVCAVPVETDAKLASMPTGAVRSVKVPSPTWP